MSGATPADAVGHGHVRFDRIDPDGDQRAGPGDGPVARRQVGLELPGGLGHPKDVQPLEPAAVGPVVQRHAGPPRYFSASSPRTAAPTSARRVGLYPACKSRTTPFLSISTTDGNPLPPNVSASPRSGRSVR